jgi:hypothetical protein
MDAALSALQGVNGRIRAALEACGRGGLDVTLVAVSKAFGAEAVRMLARAGQRRFGESYVKEALAKMAQLSDLDLEWHFIGPIQSNKTRPIALHFDWVHSVDRAHIADRLADARPMERAPLNVLVQVNVSREATKHGADIDAVVGLADVVRALPRLRLRGLMAIPRRSPRPGERRQEFARVRALFDALNNDGYGLDTLSMGMSDDLEEAIAEGATMVRVGTALFGGRDRGEA